MSTIKKEQLKFISFCGLSIEYSLLENVFWLNATQIFGKILENPLYQLKKTKEAEGYLTLEGANAVQLFVPLDVLKNDIQKVMFTNAGKTDYFNQMIEGGGIEKLSQMLHHSNNMVFHTVESLLADIVDGAIKCMWMFDPKYVNFLGQLHEFDSLSNSVLKKLKSEIENFNYDYSFIDFQLPFLVAKEEDSDTLFIESVLLRDFFGECDVPSGFQTLVEWIKKDITDCEEEVNDGTIATHYRYFIEQAIEKMNE